MGINARYPMGIPAGAEADRGVMGIDGEDGIVAMLIGILGYR